MIDGLWWREEDADYIGRRSDRYPGATDLEVTAWKSSGANLRDYEGQG